MDLWSLKVLDAVVSAGSVSDAALLVHRTQPQISRIISALEHELGFALFIRQSRRMTPTPNCLSVLVRARRILHEFDALGHAAGKMRNEQSPLLHIVGPSYAFHGVLPLIVASIRDQAPNVPITLSTLVRQDSGQWAVPEHFDIGVAVLPFDIPNTSQQIIGSQEVALLVHRTHPLASIPLAQPKDLVPFPFIALRSTTPLRRHVDRIMNSAGLELDIAVTVPDNSSALRMVIENIGITLGDALSAKHVGGDRVVAVPFAPKIQGKLGVFWPSDLPKTVHFDAFVAAAKAVLKQEQSAFIHS